MNLKSKFNLLIIILLILISVFIAFVIYPIFSGIEKNSRDIISQKENLVSLETKTEKLISFKAMKSEAEQNLEKMNSLFIDASLPINFINFLEKTAKDYNLTLKISSSQNQTEEDWPYSVFQIQSAASFSNLSKFLSKLETSDYLIKIQSLDMNKGKDSSLVDTNLIIRVFSK